MKRLLSHALIAAALMPLSVFAGTYSFTVDSTTTNNSYLLGISHGSATTWGLSGTNYTSLFNDINTGGQVVTSATLTLNNIYDWTTEANDPADALYVNILAGLNTGLATKVFDSAAAGRTQDLSWPTQNSPFFDNSATTGDWNDTLQAATALNFTDASAGSLLKANAADTKNSGGYNTPTSVTWSDPNGGAARGFNLVLTFNSTNLSVLTALLDADTSTGAPNVGLGFAAECHYYMTSATLTVTTGTASVPESGSTLALMGAGLLALAAFRRAKK